MQVYLLIYFEIQKFLSADNSISGLTRSFFVIQRVSLKPEFCLPFSWDAVGSTRWRILKSLDDQISTLWSDSKELDLMIHAGDVLQGTAAMGVLCGLWGASQGARSYFSRFRYRSWWQHIVVHASIAVFCVWMLKRIMVSPRLVMCSWCQDFWRA